MNDSNKNSKNSNGSQQKKKLGQSSANVLETLKNVGQGFGGDLASEAKRLPADFARQLFGLPQIKRSGEITPGGQVEMDKVRSGQQEKEDLLNKQLAFERRLRHEEQELRSSKEQDLRLQLKAIMDEIGQIAKETPQLDQELQVAAIQAPANPGIYHLFFFEQILTYLKSFRKKIHSANTWLHAANAKAAKKGGNTWGARYKKHGAKYLLSQEHYLTRSAG